MRAQTEFGIRAVISLDEELRNFDIERAIDILKGSPKDISDICTVVSYHEAMRILEVSRPALNGYIRAGYITRVFGLGGRAIGINGNSLEAFRHRRIVHKGTVRQ